jgi:hypothetical protein
MINGHLTWIANFIWGIAEEIPAKVTAGKAYAMPYSIPTDGTPASSMTGRCSG